MIERSPFYGKAFDVTLITKGRPMGRFGTLVSDAFCSSESKSQTIWPHAMGIARKRDAHASSRARNISWNRQLPASPCESFVRNTGRAVVIAILRAMRCRSRAVNASASMYWGEGAAAEISRLKMRRSSTVWNWVGTHHIAPLLVRWSATGFGLENPLSRWGQGDPASLNSPDVTCIRDHAKRFAPGTEKWS